MIRNYLKIAWRTLLKNKGYSAINIGGLAIGIAVAMLIGLWIYDELSFNRYHQNYNSIAQVRKHATYDGKLETDHYLPYPLAIALKTNYQHNFKHIVIAMQEQDYDLSAGATQLTRKGQFIDDGAPEMLTLKMLQGSRGGLKDPQSILVSASAAKALFGRADPMNKLVKINNEWDVKVTGVYEDMPLNTQFGPVQFFVPFDLYASSNSWVRQQSWNNQFLFVYTQIADKTDFKKVSDNIKNAEINITRDLENFKEQAARNPKIFLQPMSKWHLYADFNEGAPDRSAIQFVWLVGIIGGFVLLLACINFMNLSTARSEKRAKEVGIRKAIGSVRAQLIHQFFTESFLVVILAYSIAVLLVNFSLPWFNDLAAKQMNMLWTNPGFWLFSLCFMLLTGLLAGSYPALYLSSFKAIKVLKGTFRVGRFADIPRKILVVTQFTVSIALIICTIIVYNQIVFAKNRPLGYNRDGLLMIQKKSNDFYSKYDLIKNELKNTGVVEEIAGSGGRITEVWSSNDGFDWKGKTPGGEDNFATLTVTHEYGKTVGWQFTAGRDFSNDQMDSSGFVINEAAAKLMGLENPIGEMVRWAPDWRKAEAFRIIGVVKDMVMESPFEPIQPTVFFLQKNLSWINVRINSRVSAGIALPKIEAVFKKLVPAAPFDYKFADDEYNKKFASEERIGKLAGFFAALAIFISCLGLFGLASYVAEQRAKEISVRKVLGASVFNVWGLLCKTFITLIVISLLIAAPLAFYFMNNWLQNYQYRSEISWWIFAATALAAMLITLLTVSFQAIKAAIANPVKSLKTE